MKQNYAYLFLFYIISFTAFSQNAPIIQTTISEPMPVCQLGECTTLLANYPSIKQTNSYTVAPIVYNPPYSFFWDGVASHRIGAVGDDSWSPIIALPFNFCFYGVNYNQVLIGTNGVITFDQANQAPLGGCPWQFSTTIPNAGFPIKNAIYGVYQDTNIATPPIVDPVIQNVNYYFLDIGPNAAPNRVLVINFNELPQYSCNNSVGLQTSQIVLYESTNIIDVNVSKRTPCTSWNPIVNGGNGLIGIQNQAGNNAVVPPNRNTGSWTTTNESWRFTPSGAAVVPSNIVWKKNNVVIANTNPVTVCPTGPEVYSVFLTYTPTCGNPFTITTDITVDIEGPQPVLNPQDITICNSGLPPYTVNINQNVYMLNGASATDYEITYYETAQDAADEANPIPNPNAYLLTTAPPKTIYTRIYNTNTGCYNVRPFQILGASPSGTFSYASSPYCNTLNTAQPVTTAALTSGGTYTATPSGLLIDATTGAITPYGSTPGIYQINYGITGACTYSTNATVEITDCQCTVTASNTGPICEGSTFGLSVNTVPGSTYSWTGPNGFTSTDQNPVNVPAPTGTPPFIYEVTATATVGINVCTSQTTVVVNALSTISGTLTVCQGLQTQLTGTLTPAVTNAWTSFNPAVATVNNTGLVTAISPGTTTITYTALDGCSATAVVTVNPLPIISGTLAVCVGLQTQLTGSATPATTNAWTSSNTAVAAIDATGLVTGVTAGTSTITYTNSNGCIITAVINVKALPVISGTLSVCVGLTTQLSATQIPATTNAWVSSNPIVATVDNTGLVTALALGTTTITYATFDGCTSTAIVTVNDLPTITGTLAVCSGFQTQLTGSASPAAVNAWVSSNNAVATVNTTGLVTGVSAGTATITYTNSNGCIVTANVQVDGSPTITGTLSACLGLQTQLTGSGSPAITNAWVSSNPSVATVDATGLVTTVTLGGTTITYTNSNGCFATANVTVNDLPTITGTLAVCTGLQTQLTGSATPATTNAWVSSNPAVATVNNTGSVTGVSTGTSTITYTNSNGCIITAVVTVNPLPSITGTLAVCVGLQTQLTGSATPATTNAWTSSNTAVATIDATGLVTGITAGTSTITYTNSNGCIITAVVNVKALPVISGTLSVCVGLTTQLSATQTPATTSAWVSSNPVVATINNTGLVTALALGTTTITYTTFDGCTTTAVVTVNDLPTITGTLAVCSGFQTQLTGSASPAAVNAWVSSNTAVATVNGAGLVTGVSAGTATITYTNSNGCIVTANVQVDGSPTITGILSACLGLQTQLTGSGSPAVTNAWVSSNPAVATVSATGLVTTVTLGSTTITYTNSNGCFATANVTVNDLPTITGTLTVCTGLQTQLTGSASPATTNAWVSSNTAVATVNNTGSVTGVSTGTATITYTNSNGCVITAVVTVNPLPTISGTLAICIGTQTQLTGSATPAATNAWTSSNTAVATIDATGLVNGVAQGTSIITYTNSNGCIITANFIVDGPPTITGTLSVCLGLQTQLTGSPSPAATNAWVSSNPSVATINSAGLVTAVTVGTTTITYTNSSGCFNTATVTVNDLPTITGTLTVCEGLQTQLTGSSTPAITNAWTSSNTAVATINNSGSVTGVSPGTATITYTNSNGCIITAIVTVNPLPQVTLQQNGFICVDVTGAPLPASTYELNTNLSATAYSFIWFDSTGVIAGETGNSYIVTEPGNYSVQVTNISTTCSSIATANVVASLPPASAVASSTSYFEDNQIVTVTVSPAGDYEYQLDNGFFQESNQFSNLSAGTHVIWIRDKYSCGMISISIEIYDYPKFFTPNGDGYNDTWNIPVLADQTKSKIYIFDKYGKLIKEISPRGTGWDGTFNSKQLPSSDYWFKVYYEEMGISKEFKAHFSLKR